jgi:hypothetical protein
MTRLGDARTGIGRRGAVRWKSGAGRGQEQGILPGVNSGGVGQEGDHKPRGGRALRELQGDEQ